MKSAKVEYATKGFQESGIFQMNPKAIKRGKLAPTKVYKKPKPMPKIADESIIRNEDGNKEVPNDDPAPTPLTSMANVNDESPMISMKKMGNMIIGMGKRKFECVLIESANTETENSKDAKLDEIFATPQAQQRMAKMGGHMNAGAPQAPPLHI